MSALPTHISRYEIKSLIGRGGMGDLYLAFDPNTNRLVALKLLNATLDSNELRERFAREARALAALNHTNIVNIYDTGEFEDSPFIVMEYVRGETLSELIRRRAALSVPQKLKLMAELCAGLAQAHEAGIIHRDIKPANLMVDQQGRLKILDFGIARVAEGGRTRVGLPLTQVNMLIGTPGYMSPEQIEGGEVDHRSDIFAVGAVCYELFAYGEAFAGANTRQIESRVLRGQPAPLASVVPGLDPEIDEIVLRALKRDPNKRYQDAATFEKALERVRLRLGPEAASPPRRPTPPAPSARSKSREARAEAAYQRALGAHNGGATEAARRFAVEALAEDPSHAAARGLLARLQPRPPIAPTAQTMAPLEPLPATMISTSAGAVPTRASAPTNASAPTRASAPTNVSDSTISSAATVIYTPPAARRPPFWKRYQVLLGGNGRSRKSDRPLPKYGASSVRWHESIWTRHRRAAMAVAVLMVLAGVVGVAGGVMLLVSWLRPSGQLLTINKPNGGTVLAAGIRCGTSGSDCSSSRPNGDAIELTPEADTGFAFAGYTGDCAPGGRTIMTTARTCGVNFAPIVSGPPGGPTQPLTIFPVPTGGTVVGVNIKCSATESACSANLPEGVPFDLRPIPDEDFTFTGYVGDCLPLGQTLMSAPRTCSATFVLTSKLAKPPVLPPNIAGGNRSAGTNAAVQPPGRDGGSPRPPTDATAKPPATPAAAPVLTPPAVAAPTSTPPGPVIVQPVAVVPPAVDPKQLAPPPSPEEFSKVQIQALLKEFCAAYEAIDPDAVQKLYPSVDMTALRKLLNRSAYKSVQCKLENPVFLSLDAPGGNAKVQADLTRAYEHTVGSEKPSEQIVTMTLTRPDPRGRWLIATAAYKAKPPK